MTAESLDTWLDRAEQALKRAGAKEYEIYASEEDSSSAEAMDGVIHAVEAGRERALAVRVIAGGIGFAATTDGTDPALDRAAASAMAEARVVRPAKLVRFAEALGRASKARSEAEPSGDGRSNLLRPGTVDRELATAFLDPRATGRPRPLLSEIALAVEAEALSADRRVARVRPAQVSEAVARTLIRTSGGLAIDERSSRAFATVGAVAEGREGPQIAFASCSGGALEALEIAPIAARATDRAVRRLGAGPFKTGVVPVILSFEAVADLLDVLLAALLGDAIERRASFLAAGIGSASLSERITVVDRPRDLDLDGACVFDGEGLPTADRVLIDRGRIVGVLDDRETAARAGRAPGAEAVRASALARPQAGAHGPHLVPGTEPLSELLRRAEGGVLIAELSGVHTVNEITGEMSLGAAGWAVRDGAWAEPVEGLTISGNLRDLLRGDPRPTAETEVHGGARVPALLLPEVQLASP